MPSTKATERLGDRGRAREREREKRMEPKHRSRDRDRNTHAKSLKKHRESISPSSRGRYGLPGGRDPVKRSERDRGLPDTRKIPSLMSTKLRMDEGVIRRDKDSRDGSGSQKTAVELDRAVKRAREEQERSHYWNRRVLEAEEKDPNRWGHSGYKELYSTDLRSSKRTKSRSPGARDRKGISPPRHQRQAPKRSRSRSLMRSKQSSRTGNGRSPSRAGIGSALLGKRPTKNSYSRSSPFNARSSGKTHHSEGLRAKARSSKLSVSPHGTRRGVRKEDRDQGKFFADRSNAKRHGSFGVSARSAPTARRRRMSRSKSRSVSSGSLSPKIKKKRVNNSSSLAVNASSKRSLDSKSRSSRRASDSSSSRSRSVSSSSSDDEDVLEIHARRKARRRESSISTSSSDDDSRSDSTYSSADSRKKGSRSSSVSSSSVSGGSDISGRISVNAQKKSGSPSSQRSAHADKSRTKTPDTSESKKVTSKRAAHSSDNGKNSKRIAKSVKPLVNKKTDDQSSKGESETDSGSSSDSDSEPRMTLSERFAKLTQMSTDKREFAKPLLSANEIDTKLKVVKDLRNADTKIFVDGVKVTRNATGSSERGEAQQRTKSPVFNFAEGEKQYSSDERRRYFERMEKDEPQVRPEDWSNSRVRYEYYRDRGCFDERPLTFDEYVKWEQWYYQYREWLQNEGYYHSVGYSEGSRGMGEWAQARAHSGSLGNRHVEQVRLAPFANRQHFMGRSDTLGRSIDRTPGGSLVVNIRQGGNFAGPRGRQVGIVRSRKNR